MSKFIVKGPDCSVKVPKVSLGRTLFDKLKSKCQDEIAVIEGLSKDTITYHQILKESIKCALAMKKVGIQKGDVVVIMSENNLRYMIPVLASWYIGAIINPLSPLYTARELIHAANLTRPKIIFCSQTILTTAKLMKDDLTSIENIIVFGDEAEDAKCYYEFLGNDDVDYGRFSPENFDIKEQVAAILCSSGTTGFPKGVMLSHDNIRHTFMYMSDPTYFSMSSLDITVSALPYFHIFGLFLLVNSLYSSMTIIDLCKFKPDIYLQCIQDYKATKLFLVPSLAVFLAKSPLVENYDMSSVTDVLCGAAPLAQDIELTLQQKLGIKAVRQLYGLTEHTGGVCVFPNGVDSKLGSSGILLPFVKAKVVDPETKEILGLNKPGELCFKGPYTMKGYIRDPVATQHTFDEEGYLLTGDIGYYDEEKHFFIIDRLKELIKYKGFQVPPAELEAILLTHEGVKEAAVVGLPDERAGELPIAFIVKQPGNGVKEDDLIKLIADKLSFQKRLHGGVRFVDQIPKNGSGKIMRRTLREML